MKRLIDMARLRREKHIIFKDSLGQNVYWYYYVQVFWAWLTDTANVMKSKAKNFVIRYLRRHRSTFRSQPPLATAVAIVIVIIVL